MILAILWPKAGGGSSLCGILFRAAHGSASSAKSLRRFICFRLPARLLDIEIVKILTRNYEPI